MLLELRSLSQRTCRSTWGSHWKYRDRAFKLHARANFTAKCHPSPGSWVRSWVRSTCSSCRWYFQGTRLAGRLSGRGRGATPGRGPGVHAGTAGRPAAARGPSLRLSGRPRRRSGLARAPAARPRNRSQCDLLGRDASGLWCYSAHRGYYTGSTRLPVTPDYARSTLPVTAVTVRRLLVPAARLGTAASHK